MPHSADSTSSNEAYFMASEREMSRLENNHFIYKDAMGALLLPPIDLSVGPLRILDSATADGAWIRDLAADAVAAGTPVREYVGTDIDPRKFPAHPPVGTKYQVQDINKPWPEKWKRSFDIVHQRLALVAAGPSAKQAVQNLAEMVKPGGWIQIVDNVTAPEIYREGTAMRNLIQLMSDIFAFLHVPDKITEQLKPWLEETGFVNLQERIFDAQLGASNPNPALARNGVVAWNIAAIGLIGMGQTLPAAAIFNGQDAKSILSTLKDDLNEELTATGGFFRMRVVWGQYLG